MNDKAQKAVDAARSQLGNPYVFGMWGQACTPSLRRRYAGYNPGHKAAIFKACPVLSGSRKSCAGCKWQGKLAFDCRGFTCWCLMQAGIRLSGGGCTSQWNNKTNWAQKGSIQEMPDVVCCVFQYNRGRYQHTGLHIGGGRIIHCSAGVQWGDASDKAWTHYAIPRSLYTAEEIKAAGQTSAENAPVLLKKGSRGEAVRQLQQALNAMGYACGEADGIYGIRTQAAVRRFQQEHGLTADGIAGRMTWAALKAAK